MEIYFIRHTSVNVPKGMFYGQTDVPLNETFPQEAEATCNQLKGIRFDRVYTSPLTRCTRLADFCGYPDAVRDSRLMEINFGEWEMQGYDDLKDPRLQEWYDDYFHVRATGGESFEDQLTRVSDFLNELRKKPYRQAAVFTHGGVIICAQIYAGLLKPAEAFSALAPYGGIVKMTLAPAV